MATKPLVQPEAWATDAVYTTGPFIGQPQKVVPPGAFAAEGHRPGALFPTPAEYENSQQNRITELSRWLFLGSFTGAADAHVLETNAAGRTAAQGLTLIDAVDETVLAVTGINTVAPTALYTCTTGATLVQAAMGAAAGTGFLATTGVGATAKGFWADMIATPGGGTGVNVSADAASAGVGVRITHAGSGQAILVTGNSGAPAIQTVAAGNQSGIQATGSGSGPGVFGISSATAGAPAIVASMGNNTGAAVSATTAGGSTTAARGVLTVAAGSGAGLEARAVAYYAAILQGDTTNPLYSALTLIGSNVRPSVATGGDVGYVNSPEDNLVVGSSLDGAFRGFWTTTGGKATAYTASANGAQNIASTTGTVVWATLATASATAGNAPKVAGREAVLRFRCEVRNTAIVVGPSTLELRFFDSTAGAVIAGSERTGAGAGNTAGFLLPELGTGWQRSIVYDFRITVPTTGDRTWVVQGRTTTGTNIVCRDCSLMVDGLF